MPRRTPPQYRADKSLVRFLLSVWGRQSGKTTYGYRKLVWKPMLGRKMSVYWHILQTYAAADIVFDRYMRFIHPHRDQLVTYKNESERRVELKGGRNIFFKSGQNFEDLRTESLDGVVIDEARQQAAELWPMVIFPMLVKSGGWADILTSPNGFDWVFDLKKSKELDPNWGVIHAPSWEAWWWTPEQIAEAKNNMSDLQFRQEIGAEFVNLKAGRVYYAYGDHNLADECPFAPGKQWSPYHPIVLGLDFNVNPMSWTLGQFAYDTFWWFDEIHLPDSNTPEAAKVLVEKILLMREQGFRATPIEVTICGDASGNNRSTKGNDSDFDILKQTLKAAGITFKDITPEANPPVKDRVNAVNFRLKSASGKIGMYIHRTYCKWVRHDMERVVWKVGADFNLDPGKNRQLTHSSDSVGYPVVVLAPIKAVREVGRMTVLNRTI